MYILHRSIWWLLSGELVSWPGLSSPGTDGGSLGPEKQLRCSSYSALAVLLLWLFLSAWRPIFLQQWHFLCMPMLLCLQVHFIWALLSKLNRKDKSFNVNGLQPYCCYSTLLVEKLANRWNHWKQIFSRNIVINPICKMKNGAMLMLF